MQSDNAKFKIEFNQRLYDFVLRLVRLTTNLSYNPITKVIIDQLIRSGTSILANYTEAGASSSRKEFTNFFQYSLKSANETALWIKLLQDTSNGDKKELEYLVREVKEISNIFASSILKLKGKK